jgi:indole-3-glycerol phosphate synthase
MLEEILQTAQMRADALQPHLIDLRVAATSVPLGPDFGDALAQPGLQVIAEIKRESPSAGAIAPGLDPADLARSYEAGGAAAISVVTEPNFFGGSLEDLVAVCNAVDLPVLRKDFILDETQMYEAKAAGADAVLLIVAALDERSLSGLLTVAAELEIEALVEAHDEAELELANRSGATIIGVNNRDLRTFETDLGTAEALAPSIVAPIAVAESGVSTAAAAARMAAAGFDAILVGEALVRSPDPAALVAELRAAGQ